MIDESGFQKHTVVLRVSREMLDHATALQESLDRWWQMTPEERQAVADQARERRMVERETATTAPLTLDAVLERLGWSREYAEHFVQPFCGCRDSSDGWDFCVHAEDLRLTR